MKFKEKKSSKRLISCILLKDGIKDRIRAKSLMFLQKTVVLESFGSNSGGMVSLLMECCYVLRRMQIFVKNYSELVWVTVGENEIQISFRSILNGEISVMVWGGIGPICFGNLALCNGSINV